MGAPFGAAAGCCKLDISGCAALHCHVLSTRTAPPSKLYGQSGSRILHALLSGQAQLPLPAAKQFALHARPQLKMAKSSHPSNATACAAPDHLPTVKVPVSLPCALFQACTV